MDDFWQEALRVVSCAALAVVTTIAVASFALWRHDRHEEEQARLEEEFGSYPRHDNYRWDKGHGLRGPHERTN